MRVLPDIVSWNVQTLNTKAKNHRSESSLEKLTMEPTDDGMVMDGKKRWRIVIEIDRTVYIVET